MAGITDVDIANLALTGLGQPTITAFTDDVKAARLIRATYEPTVKSLLRGHPWRCARKQQKLTYDSSATPPFGFDYACPLPADFIQVVKINDNMDKYQVMGGYLMIDDTAPELTYTARVTEDMFDPGLVDSIVARLEWRLCKPLTDSTNDMMAKQKEFEAILQDAKYADALDGAPDDPPMGTWAEARIIGVTS